MYTSKDKRANPSILDSSSINSSEIPFSQTSLSSFLDRIISIRAIQDFAPSGAIAFIFLLKKAVREKLEREVRENGISQEVIELESRIDGLALLSLDIYMKHREKLYEIRVNEIKNRESGLIRSAGLISELEEEPDLDLIVTPIGGGGLLSGSTLSASVRSIPTIGAEPELVDDAYRSLRDGHRYGPTGAMSVGDGLLTGIGALPFAILSHAGTDIITVSETSILEALQFVVSRTKYVIGPYSATVFAALFDHAERFAGKRIGVIVTGGNVELSRLGG